VGGGKRLTKSFRELEVEESIFSDRGKKGGEGSYLGTLTSGKSVQGGRRGVKTKRLARRRNPDFVKQD